MLKKMGLLAAALMASTAGNAATFNFTFTSGASVFAAGTLTTSDTADANGGYLLTGISGTIYGAAITGVYNGPASFSYDNLLFLGNANVLKSGSYVNLGIAVSTTASNYNIYESLSNGFGGTPAEPNGLFDGSYVYPAGATTGLFALSPVPEPAQWALMLAGMAMIGGAMRRSRSLSVRFA